MLLALGCSTPHATALDMQVGQHRGKRILLLQGKFESEDGARFENVLTKAPPVDEVWFDSGGGSTIAGYAIGRAIRRAGLSVRLPSKGICASACADAFMGGVARRVEEGGRFGIHMATAAHDKKWLSELLREVVALITKAAKDGGAEVRESDLNGVRSHIQKYEQAAALEAATWATYIIEMGGSLRLVALGTETEAASMNFLKRSELLDLNVVNVDN